MQSPVRVPNVELGIPGAHDAPEFGAQVHLPRRLGLVGMEKAKHPPILLRGVHAVIDNNRFATKEAACVECAHTFTGAGVGHGDEAAVVLKRHYLVGGAVATVRRGYP